jgi:beta-barrel assembly-enhancing protease
MKKILFQGLISVILFFAIWLGLKQFDLLKIFKVQKITNKTEQKLGDLFWEMISKSEKELKQPFLVNCVDSLVAKICTSNKIDEGAVKIHIINKDIVNAFALPNGHLVVYSGLILNAENQEELCGVLGHEIAHIQLNHVMKKLVKEVGLSALISITTGSGGTEIIKESIKILSSSAFDRSLEKEADMKAVDYLVEAKINPEPFANFLYKISEDETGASQYFTWISTHPESKERAEYIIEYSKGKLTEYDSLLSDTTWQQLKSTIQLTVSDEE